MIKVDVDSWAKTFDGDLLIANKTFRLPDLRLGSEIGRGANAVVFEAVETILDRPVAVKIWNSRGRQRAKSETAKIARLHHPLIVTTHSLNWVDGYPYAVMELVTGESGRRWLTANQSIEDRLRVWQLYSRALRYVHEQGAVHGDPHVGNILVYRDLSGHFHESASDDAVPIGIKVADAGTSEFLPVRNRLLQREADLIFETAKRLFHYQNVDSLWSHPRGLTHQQTLTVLKRLVDFILYMVKYIDYDHATENAERLVRFTLETPLFNLDGVLANFKSERLATRFARRLNRDLFELHDLFAASETVGQDTQSKYAARRATYLRSL